MLEISARAEVVDWTHLSLPEEERGEAQVGRAPLPAQPVIADLCFSLFLGSGQLTLIIKQ